MRAVIANPFIVSFLLCASGASAQSAPKPAVEAQPTLAPTASKPADAVKMPAVAAPTPATPATKATKAAPAAAKATPSKPADGSAVPVDMHANPGRSLTHAKGAKRIKAHPVAATTAAKPAAATPTAAAAPAVKAEHAVAKKDQPAAATALKAEHAAVAKKDQPAAAPAVKAEHAVVAKKDQAAAPVPTTPVL